MAVALLRRSALGSAGDADQPCGAGAGDHGRLVPRVPSKLPWPGKHEAARTTAQCAIEVHQRDIRTRPLRFRCTGWTPSAAEDGYAEPVARDPGGVTAFHQCRFTRPEVNGWARIRDVALPRPGTTTPTVGDRGHFGTRVSRSHH